MKLTLTVEKTPDPSLQGSSMSFGASGGTIGRAGGNDWVLPDPNFYTSGRHAEIKLDGGRFVVVDTSTNGTFHNAPEQLVGKGRSAPLADGDRLYIGEFILVVGIETAGATTDSAAAPPAGEDDDDDDLLLPPMPDEQRAISDTAPDFAAERDEFDDLLEGAGNDTPDANEQDDGDLPFSAPGRRLEPLDFDDDDQPDPNGPVQESTAAGLSQSPEREYFSAPGVGAEESAEDIPDEWDALLTGFFEPPSKSTAAEEFDSVPGSEPEPSPPAAPSPAPAPASVSPAPSSSGSSGIVDDSDDLLDLAAGGVPEDPPPRRPSPPRPVQRSEVRAAVKAPPRSGSSSGREGALVAALMQELGLGDDTGLVDAEDFGEQVGKVVRLVGEGLMQLLASRAEIKNEFRIDQTRIASSRNNPLKFSPSVEEAMRRIFVERDAPGFISGAEAFELALNDLRAHQVAILAAVQGAIESVIRQFNPEELERKLKKLSPLSASAPLIREAKCWSLFVSHYEEMASNLRHDAKRVFVREFAEAYERSSSEIARQIAESRGKNGSNS